MSTGGEGEMDAEPLTYRTSPFWRVMGVVAILNAAGVLVVGPFVASDLGDGWRDLPTAILVSSFVLAASAVLFLWGLRRLTERVQLRDGVLVYSVLGRTQSMQLSDVVRVRDKRRWLRANWQSPWRMVSISDARGRRITLTNYIEHLNAFLVQLKWRTNEDVDAEWHRFRFWLP